MQASRIEDLFRHVTLGSLLAHPGGWCFTAQRIKPDQDAAVSSLWGISPGGEVTRLLDDASGAAWDEEGRMMAYLGTDASGATEVFVFDAHNRDTRQVTTLGGSISSIEQVDGLRRRLLVLRVEKLQDDPDAPVCVDYVPVKQDGIGPAGVDVVRLGTVDLDTGEYTACVEQGADVLEARWDPAHERLAYVQRPDGRQRHGSDLWLREGTDPPRRIGDGLASVASLVWNPDGRRLALAAATDEGDSMTWLHVLDVESNESRRFEVEMGVPSSLEWEHDGESIRVVQGHQGLQRIVRVRPDGNVETVYGREDMQVQEIATQASTTAFIAAEANHGPEVWLMEGGGERPRKVTTFNAWRCRRKPLKVERRQFTVPDGLGGEEQVDGWLALPEGDGPFPLLLSMHGGPQVPASLAYERHVHVNVLVERGWAVLALNAVGSATYGTEFARRLRGHWGERDYPQWQAAVRSLRQEGIAGTQVAVFGHSYGGFLAAWALTQDPSLACGIVSAGVLNIESHAGTSDTGYYVSPYAMDAELPEARDQYRRLSPVSHAERIRAPVLILQGEDDQRCPIGQAEELFTTLVRHTDVPARLMRFPGGDHHVSTTGKPSHRRAYFQAMVDWLETHVAKDAQPASGDDGNQAASPAAPGAPDKPAEHAPAGAG